MTQTKEKWYKSPGYLGLIITLGGFAFFTLLFKWLSERLTGQ